MLILPYLRIPGRIIPQGLSWVDFDIINTREYSSGSYKVMQTLRLNTKEFYPTGSYFKPIFVVI
jgi:hypothetical protein